MKHFGDITQIKGSEVPIVDVVTGGSPCQDLSVAGKRAGLDGERSGLFMEQIRIVKEMREHDRATRRADEHIRCVRPRYMVWENVPGAFSSNKGKDFQAVLTEITRIVCKDCPDVPLPKKGKWPKSGCLMGYGDDGQPFSVAYRLHDSQFWGVPQRRRRIALVADFGGTSAPEILFERESVSGNTEQSGQAGEETSRATGTGANPSINVQSCAWDGSQVSPTLTSNNANGAQRMPDKDNFNAVIQKKDVYAVDMGGGKSSSDILNNKAPTLATTHYGEPAVCYQKTTGCLSPGAHAGSYNGQDAYNDMLVIDTPVTSIDEKMGQTYIGEEIGNTLSARDYKQPQAVVYGLDRASFNQGKNAQYDFSVEEELAQPIVARGPGGAAVIK